MVYIYIWHVVKCYGYKKVKKKQIKQKTKVKNKSSVYKCFYKYFSFSITMTTKNCVNPLLT